MSDIDARIKAVANEQLDLGRDPDFGKGLGQSGVSSVDAVAFFKKVGEEFGVEIPPLQIAEFKNLSDLSAWLASNAS